MTDLEIIGASVIDAARELFEDYGILEDFTIRIGGDVVFGSKNQIRWTPSQGFIPDRTNCTRPFLDRWDGDN